MTLFPSIIEGFSRLSRHQQQELIISTYGLDPSYNQLLASFRHPDPSIQGQLDSFSENTLTNYPLPLGIAPNFLINDRMYALPLLTEESSVVAAAANAAKYWAKRGGFHTRVLNTLKSGQVHFQWDGAPHLLHGQWEGLKGALTQAAAPAEESMKNRGGGIRSISLVEKTEVLKDYWQIDVTFDTRDAMGANFINTCLEAMARGLEEYFRRHAALAAAPPPRVIMAILSNYTPECVVEATVSCRVEQLSSPEFAQKFKVAVDIARAEVKRAVTHNKGIMNGVDALVLATGNDFRAVEANGHAFAARSGRYEGLSECTLEEGVFTLTLTLPMAVGTVGGLTSLHPLARFSMELLGNPKATDLMQIAAAAGLASNYAAVSTLVSSGIQKGHMKMHLTNILNAQHATPEEQERVKAHFANHPVSVSAVKQLLQQIRKQ